VVSPHSRRESDSEALSIAAPADQPEQKKAKATPAQLQPEALEALEAGNLSELDQVVMKLMEKSAELSDARCLPVAGNGAWQRALRLLASETE